MLPLALQSLLSSLVSASDALMLGLLDQSSLYGPVPVVYFLLNPDEIGKIPVVIRHFRKYKWVKNLTRKEQST